MEFSDLILFGPVAAWVLYQFSLPNPRKFADRMVKAVQDRLPEPFQIASAIRSPTLRGKALWEAHRTLSFEELDAPAHEALRLAAQADPEMYVAELYAQARAAEDQALCIALSERVLERKPLHTAARRTIGHHLVATGRPEDALALLDRGDRSDPELMVARARALIAMDRRRDALLLLDALVARLTAERRGMFNQASWGAYGRILEDAGQLADGLRAELLGSESVSVAAAHSGRMDPRAAVNHRLLGQALMKDSERLVRKLEISSVAEDSAQADRLLGFRPTDLHGLCLRGLCALRTGKFDVARQHFERARKVDGRYFPAAMGYAAALTLSEARAWGALADLPDPDLPTSWEGILPDLPALTPEERRVVSASVHPLRALLPALASAGAMARLLPLDVRPTDLPQMAQFEEHVSRDHRAVRALGGVATERLALSRIEDLLDTSSEHSFVFAHEFAHICRHVLPELWQARLADLHRAALSLPHVLGQYQVSNIDEFFAVSYQNWLRARYDRVDAPIHDEEGLVDRLHGLFEEIDGMEGLI